MHAQEAIVKNAVVPVVPINRVVMARHYFPVWVAEGVEDASWISQGAGGVANQQQANEYKNMTDYHSGEE